MRTHRRDRRRTRRRRTEYAPTRATRAVRDTRAAHPRRASSPRRSTQLKSSARDDEVDTLVDRRDGRQPGPGRPHQRRSEPDRQLNGLIVKATAIDDLITARERRSPTPGRARESLEAQQRGLEDQMSMSTTSHSTSDSDPRRPRRCPVTSGPASRRLERIRRILGGPARGARRAAPLADHRRGVIAALIIWIVRCRRRRAARPLRPPTAAPSMPPTRRRSRPTQEGEQRQAVGLGGIVADERGRPTPSTSWSRCRRRVRHRPTSRTSSTNVPAAHPATGPRAAARARRRARPSRAPTRSCR